MTSPDAQFAALEREVAEAVHEETKAVARYAARGLVLKTPVLTGLGRGNWRAGIGAPEPGVRKGAKDKEGDNTVSAMWIDIERSRPFEAVHLTNPLHYVRFMEDGTAKMPPIGMVGLTLAEIQSRFGGTGR